METRDILREAIIKKHKTISNYTKFNHLKSKNAGSKKISRIAKKIDNLKEELSLINVKLKIELK